MVTYCNMHNQAVDHCVIRPNIPGSNAKEMMPRGCAQEGKEVGKIIWEINRTYIAGSARLSPASALAPDPTSN